MTGVYGWSPGKGGVHFHRIAEPLRVLAAHGHDAATGVALDDATCTRFAGGTVLVHMLWQPELSEAWRRLADVGHHRLVYDIDDVMWAPDFEPFRKHYTPAVLDQIWENIRISHVVTTPTDYIADYVSQFNANVHVVPNSVPRSLLHRTPRRRPRFTLGYQGSASHRHDITGNWQRQIRQFLDWFPTWGMTVWGELGTTMWGELAGTRRLRVEPWQGSLTDYYKGLSMDIGLGPAQDTAFNRGKSGLRAVEYAALGIPAVLTDLPGYRPYVVEGVSGYLVRHPDDWRQMLHFLADNHDVRVGMGRRAREFAAEWTTEARIHNWTEAWNSV